MAFTGTFSPNTNIIINTSTVGTYLFKEPNIDYNIETITKQIELQDGTIFQISEDIFQSTFVNEELNNYFGIQKSKKESELRFLSNDYKTRKKFQIFPNRKKSALLNSRFRDKFIFQHWRDDDYLSNSSGWALNLSKTRRATSSDQSGYTTPTLFSSHKTHSIWPLDVFTQTDVGHYVVAGELMSTMMPNILASNVLFNPIASYAPAVFISTVNAYTSSLPWMAGIQGGSKPFEDSENFFSKDIVKKYKNYSTISEYNISQKITSQNFSNIKNILFEDSFGDLSIYTNSFSNTGSYLNIDTEPIIFSNKQYSFNIDSVIKLRPYKNFYPVFNSLECAKLLSQTLSQDDVMNSYWFQPVINMVLVSILFYGPGIMYNSIKAGMPMSFLGGQSTGNRYIHCNFESILDPINFLLNKELGTNIILTRSLNTEQYKNCIFNFLTEIKNTFCKNKDLQYFKSKKEDEFQIFESGTVYAMDLSLKVGTVQKNSNTEFNWIGGVNYIGTRSFGSSDLFPNTPPWMRALIDSGSAYNGLSTTRISFTPTLTRKYTLDEIFSLASIEHRIDKITTCSAQSHPGVGSAFYPKVTSSFDIFEKTSDDSGNVYWNIKSKWEFPFLSMTGSSVFTYSSGLYRTNDCLSVVNNKSFIGGLWHDFCEVPREDEGLFLQLSDVSFFTNSIKNETSSLASMVGFKNQTKRVGELNSSKEISELICILPISKKTNSLYKIEKNSQLYQENKLFLTKYLFPPRLDYLLDGIESSMFFCIPVYDEWSRRDLAFIWQNMLPQNGLFHKEKNNIYSINDECREILKNEEIYFKIFKCKERSITNPHGSYGYNYPYDQMSLIELCKIDLIEEN